MKKLQGLIKKTKGSITLEINCHKDCYETVEQYLEGFPHKKYINDVEQEVYDKMVETDTVIELQVYPNNPIGFYKIYHYDLNKILEIALTEK